VSRMGRNAAPANYVVTQKSWGRYAPHRDTRCSGQVLPDTDYGDHAACCSIAIGDR